MYRGLSIVAFIGLALIAQTRLDRAAGGQQAATVQDLAVERFANTLMAWKTSSDYGLKLQATQAFLDLAQGANRPSPDSVRLFLDNLLAAVAKSRLTTNQAARLGFDFHEVLHCAFLNEERFEDVLKDVSRQLVAAGVSRVGADGLVSRLRTIGDEVRDSGRVIDTMDR